SKSLFLEEKTINLTAIFKSFLHLMRQCLVIVYLLYVKLINELVTLYGQLQKNGFQSRKPF
ncbi:hypothetical protein, partial [Bacillus thuringiensis]|uniref:hypothetical protein n=1 Tax=Bacillus thuringiensis TaxID=1428 RepID=UPI00197AB97C